MRDVVIVGGGLSGLVTAYELSKYPDLNCTLIEVKRRLGGSIESITQQGSILDGGAFALAPTLDATWLSELGLDDAIIPLSDNTIALKNGTESLINALKSKITATRLMRMAVSSIGELGVDDRFSICMENGLMFDARALILAVPARYAERMFYGYITPITKTLLGYHYDTIHRVSLVCETTKLPERVINPPDMGYSFIQIAMHPSRVPDGYTLLQFGLRLLPSQVTSSQQLIDFVQMRFNLPEPLTAHVGYWSEADPISRYDDDHADRMQSIQSHLPTGIELIGSDYTVQAPLPSGITDLQPQIQQAQNAVQNILKIL